MIDGSQPPCSPLDDVVGESGLGLAVNDRVSKVDQQQPHSQHIRPRQRRQVGNHVTLEPAAAGVVNAESNVKLLADCSDTPVHRKVHSWMGIGSGGNSKQIPSNIVDCEKVQGSGSAANNNQPISVKLVDNDTSIKVESHVLVDDATALLSSVGASTPRLPPTLPTVSILKTRPKYSKPLGTTSESVHEQSKLVDGEFNSRRVDPLVHVSTEPELHRETNAGLVRDLVLERPQRGPTPRLPQDSYAPLAVNSVEGYVPRTDQSNRAAAVAFARPAAEPKAPEALVGDDTSTAPPKEAAIDAVPVNSIRKRGAKSFRDGRSVMPSAQTSLVATPATPAEVNASDDEVPLVFSSLADLMEKAGTLPDQNDGQPQVVEADVAFRCYDPDDYIGRVAQNEVLAKVEQYHQIRTTDSQTPANVRQERLVEDSEDDDPSTSSTDGESDDESQDGVGGLMDLMGESDDEGPPPQPAERVFLQLWRTLTHWITPLSVKYVQFLERGHFAGNAGSSTGERIAVNEIWEDGQWNWQAEINGDTRSVDRSGRFFIDGIEGCLQLTRSNQFSLMITSPQILKLLGPRVCLPYCRCIFALACAKWVRVSIVALPNIVCGSYCALGIMDDHFKCPLIQRDTAL
jgi:hypothetical protein